MYLYSAILESKLDSVPELNSVTSPTIATTTTASATTAESSPAGPPATPVGPAVAPAGPPGDAVEVPATQVGDAPPTEEELQVLKRKVRQKF